MRCRLKARPPILGAIARSARAAGDATDRYDQDTDRLTGAMFEAVSVRAVALREAADTGAWMVHLTLAIADFMMILITAALWSAASIGGTVVIGLVALGGVAWGVRRMMRRGG